MTLSRSFILTPLLLGCLCAAQASNAPFTGLSVTAGVGGIAAQANMSQTGSSAIDGFPASYTNHQDSFQSNIAGMVGVGYSYQFHQGLVLGGVITSGFNYPTLTNTALASGGLHPLPTITLYGTLETQLKNDFALLFKPGYAFGRTLVYGLVGPRWGQFDTTLSSSTDDSTGVSYQISEDQDQQPRYQVGVAVGAGISHALLEHLIAGVEYQYTAYNGDLGSLHTAGGNEIQGVIKFAAHAELERVSTNTLMATVSYLF